MKKTDIKNSLLRQLKEKGADAAHFKALVEDYLFLWEQVKEMKKSIKEKGVTYEAVSAAGKTYEKENPAVKNLVLYSRQMLAILKDLGLKTDEIEAEEDDEL